MEQMERFKPTRHIRWNRTKIKMSTDKREKRSYNCTKKSNENCFLGAKDTLFHSIFIKGNAVLLFYNLNETMIAT